MKPRARRETGQNDLFKARLDQIVDLGHELVLLALAIDWAFLEAAFGAVYSDVPGQPPLPVRLMAGLAILRSTYNLSDEELTARWVENPYFQYFCGEEFFQHTAPFDRSSMTRWRQRMGEERLNALLQESLAVAVKTKAMRLGDLSQAVVDTTVQEKAVTFPTDAKLARRLRFARAGNLIGRFTRRRDRQPGSGSLGSPKGITSGCGRATRAWASSLSSSTSAMRMPGSSSAPSADFGR